MKLLARIQNRIELNKVEIEKAQKQLVENFIEAHKWGASDKIYLFSLMNNDLTTMHSVAEQHERSLKHYLETLSKNITNRIIQDDPTLNISLESHLTLME